MIEPLFFALSQLTTVGFAASPKRRVHMSVGPSTALPCGADGRLVHVAQQSSRSGVTLIAGSSTAGYQRRMIFGTDVATSPSGLLHESTVTKLVHPECRSVHDTEALVLSLSTTGSAAQNGQ